MRPFHTALFFLATLASFAETNPPPDGGKSITPDPWETTASFYKGKSATGEAVTFATDAPAPKGWRVSVTASGTKEWDAQLALPLSGSAKKGDRLLVAFAIRCTKSSAPSGHGAGMAVVEIKDPPEYTKLGRTEFIATPEWSTVYLPFVAEADSIDGKTFLSFQVARQAQDLEFAQVRLLNYGPDFPMEKLPRPSIDYPGREEGAAWRTEALARIEKIRVHPFTINVTGPDGKPIPGHALEATLERHAFGFGAAVTARWMTAEGPDAEAYRQCVNDNFSRVVFENDLKPFARNLGRTGTHEKFRSTWIDQSLVWLKERHITVRGHYLCWGPWEPWSEALNQDKDGLRAKINAHMDDVTTAYGEKIDEWDAINHPVGWEDPRNTIDTLLGQEFYADIIRQARTKLKTPLWVNEDQIFRPGRQQEEYFQSIKQLIDQGAAPDGIGNMAHFHSSFLPAPEEMLRISDRFAALVPNLQMTEWDVVTNGDDQLQADWLRDNLIMAYSHPAYSGFVMWVFWEGSGWRPDAALWRNDWSEKPAAAVWRDYVRNQWLTKEKGAAEQGTWSFRGHSGWYVVKATKAGKTTESRVFLDKATPSATIIIPAE